jgi:putative PIN family toxin of toxin-antitoxin system
MKSDVRVAVDTGVVVSALLFSDSTPRQAVELAVARGTLLISEQTVGEMNAVLRRSKFNNYLSEELRLEFLDALVHKAEVVEIIETITDCRDPRDNKFLELAVSGRATHLVTGDDDLLALHPFRSVAVVTPQSFLAEMARTGH